MEPGDYQIQDIEGTLFSGDEDETRELWIGVIEGTKDFWRRHSELKLVEVKAVIRRD